MGQRTQEPGKALVSLYKEPGLVQEIVDFWVDFTIELISHDMRGYGSQRWTSYFPRLFRESISLSLSFFLKEF